MPSEETQDTLVEAVAISSATTEAPAPPMRVKFCMDESEIVLVEDAAEPETTNALIFQVKVVANGMLRTTDGDSME